MSTHAETAANQRRQHPVFNLLGVQDPRNQPTETNINTTAGTEALSGNSPFPLGPATCFLCRTQFPDRNSVLVHYHTDHGEPLSKLCCCTLCHPRAQAPLPVTHEAAPDKSDADVELPGTGYIVPTQAGLDSGNELGDFDERDLWEDNLPAFMGKLESGTFSSTKITKTWKLGKCTQPEPLKDRNGLVKISNYTGKPMRILPFLPKRVPQDVGGWKLMYWERKAAEQGIDLELSDIIDRMDYRKGFRALSMNLQRQREGMGYLPLHAKEKGTFAAKQNMRTIEALTVMQAKLNTVWLPNHIQPRGPWKVIQPNYHPHYMKTNTSQTKYHGSSYIIETMYGLSDRIRDISDTMVFLDCLAIEAGLEPSEQTRSQMHGLTNVEEFEDWRECMGRGIPIADIRKALRNAPTQGAWVGVMSGNEVTVASLQTADGMA